MPHNFQGPSIIKVDLSSAAYLLGYIRARKIDCGPKAYTSDLDEQYENEYLMGYEDGLNDEDEGIPHNIIGDHAHPTTAYDGKILTTIPMTDGIIGRDVWHIYIHDQDEMYRGMGRPYWVWSSESDAHWVHLPG